METLSEIAEIITQLEKWCGYSALYHSVDSYKQLLKTIADDARYVHVAEKDDDTDEIKAQREIVFNNIIKNATIEKIHLYIRCAVEKGNVKLASRYVVERKVKSIPESIVNLSNDGYTKFWFQFCQEHTAICPAGLIIETKNDEISKLTNKNKELEDKFKVANECFEKCSSLLACQSAEKV